MPGSSSQDHDPPGTEISSRMGNRGGGPTEEHLARMPRVPKVSMKQLSHVVREETCPGT